MMDPFASSSSSSLLFVLASLLCALYIVVYSRSIPCGYVEVTSRFGIAIITVSCVGGVLAIVAAILVYAYRRRPVIK